jgi:selenocysteine lyase/cysteine desulfurase
VSYLQRNERSLTFGTIEAAGRYMEADPLDVALTDSTTMGLGLLYSGLPLSSGQEILTTEHDYYATHEAIRLSAERSGAAVRRIRLHERGAFGREGIALEPDAIAERIAAEVGPRTRVVALTWVHSGTGLKLPLARIAEAVRERAASGRPSGASSARTACTGSASRTRGWRSWASTSSPPAATGLFGPRGTGVLWGRGDAWSLLRPDDPELPGLRPMGGVGARGRAFRETTARRATPDQPFEHRWALAQAFDFCAKSAATASPSARALARQLKGGLVETPGVQL